VVDVLVAERLGLGLSTLRGVAGLHGGGFDCFTVFGRKIILALLAGVQRVSNHTDA